MIVIVSAPSGTGKTTLITSFLKKRPDFKLSVSFTTREKREEEQNGSHYHFVSKEKFLEMKDLGHFLETEEIFDNFYGTPGTTMENIILDIDSAGMQNIIKKHPEALTIGLLPPSLEILTERLEKRGEKNIKKRTSNPLEEIKKIKNSKYLLFNYSAEETLTNFCNIVEKNS